MDPAGATDLPPPSGRVLDDRPEGQVQVSVLALGYNHARFAEQCLDAIRAQTFPSVELIMADDCSRDATAEVAASWRSRHWPDSALVLHEKNMGLCRTLNELLGLARGRYVAVIAMDDQWEPNMLAQHVAALNAEPSAAVSYSDAFLMDEEGNRSPGGFIEMVGGHSTVPEDALFEALCERNFIPAMTTVMRRTALREVGYYDETLLYEDWDMWLRLARLHPFVYTPPTSASYRIVASSLSRTMERHPDYARTNLRIAAKALGHSKRGDALLRRNLAQHAEALYASRQPDAAFWLRQAARNSRRGAALAACATLGIPYAQLVRLKTRVRQRHLH